MKKEANKKKKNKKPWKDPDFEIYSLLDKDISLTGASDYICPCDCQCGDAVECVCDCDCDCDCEC